MLEDPQEKEKVSSKASQNQASQNPIIVYEKAQEKNPSPNKKNEKKKPKNELPTSYIPKAHFPTALEANAPSMFTKVFVWTR